MNEDPIKLNHLWRFILVLGAVPLITGILTFAIWCITQWPFLESLGIIILIAGPVLVLVAFLFLIIYVIFGRLEKIPTATLISRSIISLGIMLINFPVAFGIVGYVYYLKSEHVLTMENHSQSNIQNVNVSGPGVHITIDTLLPGERITKTLHFKGEGALEFQAVQDHKNITETIKHCVSVGIGGGAIIQFYDNGQFKIQESQLQTY